MFAMYWPVSWNKIFIAVHGAFVQIRDWKFKESWLAFRLVLGTSYKLSVPPWAVYLLFFVWLSTPNFFILQLHCYPIQQNSISCYRIKIIKTINTLKLIGGGWATGHHKLLRICFCWSSWTLLVSSLYFITCRYVYLFICISSLES